MGAATKGRAKKEADIIPFDPLLRVGLTPEVKEEIRKGFKAYNYGKKFTKNPTIRISSFVTAVGHLDTALESIKPNTAKHKEITEIRDALQSIIDKHSNVHIAQIVELRRGSPEGA